MEVKYTNSWFDIDKEGAAAEALIANGCVIIGQHADLSLIHISLPYTPHEMENAMHPYELPQIHYTVVRVAKGQKMCIRDRYNTFIRNTEKQF